jgi:DNA-directed RNA polymerase specialized sigma24 family protein
MRARRNLKNWMKTRRGMLFVEFQGAETTSKRTKEVTMREQERITRAGEYATTDDFRRIFDENMNSLYLLAFLLTADHGRAQQCFVSGLEDAVGGNPVFKEWAHSWARRVIIQNAARLVNPRPNNGSGRSRFASVDSDYKILPAERQVEVSAALGLEPFERIVYVTTVLEHYSDHECSLLLGCARREVLPARIRALEEIARQAELHDRGLPIVGAQNPGLHEGAGAVIDLIAVSPS